MRCLALFSCLLFLGTSVFAWDGYDYQNGGYVEIEQGQLVRPGREIEYYDYEKGEYRYGDVESITDGGSTVEVEILDQESGEYRTIEMEKE